jgi:ATP-binding cassette, subfamily B, bacterial
MNGSSKTQKAPLSIRVVLEWISRITSSFLRQRNRRIPVVLQMNNVECGAACLAMVLGYFGRRTPIFECRERCGIGRDGVTAQTIAQAARSYGLRVSAYSLEPADFNHVPLPAIVHWDFNHFVVVERWSPASVDIIDPGAGRRRLTSEEFDAGFTGVVLTLEPGVQFEQQQRTEQPAWRHYLKYVLSAPGTMGVLAQILGASLLLQVFGVVLPLFTKVLVDDLLPFQITNMITILGLGVAVLLLAQTVTSYLRATLLIYLEARLDARMMIGFFEHVLTLPFRFFQQRTTGDMLMRLGSNTMIREALTNQTASAVLDGALVLVYLAILLALEPVFGAIVSGIGLLQVALLLGTTRRLHDLMQRDLSAEADSQSYLVEALTGIATLKASGAEERALEHWLSLFSKHLNVSLERSHLSTAIESVMTALRVFSPFIMLWVGALYVLDGAMSLGTMLALNALGMSCLLPIASLVASGQQLQLAGAHLDRIADVVREEPEQNLQLVQLTPPLSGQIELKGVNFGYAQHAPLVLRDISLRIEPGQKIALIGRTGSGKSTLARLLLGLCTPTAGEILYDGLALTSFNYRTLRRQFGVVLQEPFLFSGSIRQNIAFNDPGLSLEQVIKAAQLAHIHAEIMRMPMGYETILAEGGSGLSGGQRQRLALARALAHQPVVLLLDEATSHLDALTERLVDQSLSGLSCTRIVIAHRLSTICNADLILVFDDGAIVEQGSHKELLAQHGLYAALVQSQWQTEESDSALLRLRRPVQQDHEIVPVTIGTQFVSARSLY